jgi:hypothetical protein
MWPRQGREFFFVEDNILKSVSVDVAGENATVGTPRALFSIGTRRMFDVAPDGQRFLMLEEVASAPPITLILNWSGPKH